MNNPRKVFNWRIEIDGVDQFEIQTVDLPEISVEVVEHGGPNSKKKTGGLVAFGDIVLEKVKDMLNTGTWATDWLSQVQDYRVGGGLLPDAYKRDIVIKEMDSTGTVTLSKWLCEGCWPNKVKGAKLDRMASDNTIETVTLSTDGVTQIAGGV